MTPQTPTTTSDEKPCSACGHERLDVDTFEIKNRIVELCPLCQIELLRRMFDWSYCDVNETQTTLDGLINAKKEDREILERLK